MRYDSMNIIQTKLWWPKNPGQQVIRKKAIARLSDTMDKNVVTVTAPSGFGKTTLLSQWCQQLKTANWRIAWVRLDETDNTVSQFLIYMISALRSSTEAVSERSLMMAVSSPVIPVNSILAVLINELVECQDNIILILDDFHFIRAARVHSFLKKFINYAPKNIKIVLSGQTINKMPIAKLAITGKICPIVSEVLRFNLEETKEFFCKVHKLNLSDDEIRLVHEKTEGWANALQVAALYIRPTANVKSFVDNFSGREKMIVNLFSSEVLDNLDSKLKHFLLETSILKELTSDICNYITGRSDSHKLLEDAYAKNLFITAIDSTTGTYRYHHIFQEFLRDCLEKTNPDRIKIICERACDYFIDVENIPEAIRHATAIGKLDVVTDLVEKSTPQLIREGKLIELSNWVHAFPAKIIHQRPGLCLSLGWVYVHTPHSLDGLSILKRARDLLAIYDLPDTDMQLAELHVLTAGLMSANERCLLAHKTAIKWIDSIPDRALLLKGTLYNILAYSDYVLGRMDDAHNACREGRYYHNADNSIFGVIYADMLLGLIEKSRGNLFNAAQHFRESIDFARKNLGEGSYSQCLISACLSELYYEWNDLDTASELLSSSVDIVEEAGTPLHILSVRLHLSRIAASKGNISEALSIIKQPKKIGGLLSSRRVRASILNEQVRLLLLDSKPILARMHIQEYGLNIDDFSVMVSEVPSIQSEFEHIAGARLLIEERKPKQALALLTPIAERLIQGGRMRRLVTVECLIALAHHWDNNTDAVIQTLERIIPIVSQQRFTRSLVDEGPNMVVLLDIIYDRHNYQRTQTEKKLRSSTQIHLHGILCECKKYRELLEQKKKLFSKASALRKISYSSLNEGQEHFLLEPLTAREISVTSLLVKGLSNRDIAENMNLAPETIKWYLRGIYQKLAVKNRTQASATIRALNILSD